MTEVVQIGDIILIHGDALTVCASGLVTGVDFVFTDPPYLLTSGGAGRGHLSGKLDNYYNDGKIVTCDVTWIDIAKLVASFVLPGGQAKVMMDDHNLAASMAAFTEVGLCLHRVLVWDKIGGNPNRWYMKNAEFCQFLYRPGKGCRPRTITSPGEKQILRVPRHKKETEHPTEKPVALVRQWMEMATDPGATVLDPFMGAGSMAVAAVRSRRKFIGIEIEKRWFDVAVARTRAAMADGQAEMMWG